MILRKKIKVGNWFLVGLSAIYLAKSVLHLKYEKISVLKQHPAASIYLLTTNDPTRHITFLDIKVLKVSLVES